MRVAVAPAVFCFAVVAAGCSYRGDAPVDVAAGPLGVASDVTDLVLHLQRGEQQAFVAAVDVVRADGFLDVADVRPSITVRAFDGVVEAAVAIEDFAADGEFVEVISDEPVGLSPNFLPNATIDSFSFALRCVDGPDEGVDLDVRVVAAVRARGAIGIVLGRLEPLSE